MPAGMAVPHRRRSRSGQYAAGQPEPITTADKRSTHATNLDANSLVSDSPAWPPSHKRASWGGGRMVNAGTDATASGTVLSALLLIVQHSPARDRVHADRHSKGQR